MKRRFSPHFSWFVLGSSAVLALGACRGNISEEPPIHLQQNMFVQQRFRPQRANPFFADDRAMRLPVEHTVAVDQLRENDALYRGKVDGQYVSQLPLPLTKDLLARGHDRFDIYCAVCHGGTGDGKSMLMTRKMRIPPPSYMEPRLRAQPIGYFFEVISNGVRNMPAYAVQIPVPDRWAIAAYVRALQIAGSASLDQVPEDVASRKGWRANP